MSYFYAVYMTKTLLSALLIPTVCCSGQHISKRASQSRKKDNKRATKMFVGWSIFLMRKGRRVWGFSQISATLNHFFLCLCSDHKHIHTHSPPQLRSGEFLRSLRGPPSNYQHQLKNINIFLPELTMSTLAPFVCKVPSSPS